MELLSDAVTRFYDPSFVDWVLRQAEQAQGTAEQQRNLRQVALVTAIKPAHADQLPSIDACFSRWGDPSVKPFLETARSLLVRCGREVYCYLKRIVDPAVQSHDRQFEGIKSAYMLAMVGDAGTATAIVERLSYLENPAVAFSAMQAADHLLPDGSLGVADSLEAILDRADARLDRSHKATIQQVM